MRWPRRQGYLSIDGGGLYRWIERPQGGPPAAGQTSGSELFPLRGIGCCSRLGPQLLAFAIPLFE